jgi:hypothetical protein
MKRALQAILIAGTKIKENVLYIKKKITIREGHRDYTKGPVLIGCHLLNWIVVREIIEVRHTTVGQVINEECMDDSFGASLNLLVGLQKYYPNLTMDSPVTVIRWE